MQVALLLSVLAALTAAVAAGSADCPANLHTDVVCRGAYKKGECPDGHLFVEKLVGCQLCPACVEYRGLDENCRTKADIPKRSLYYSFSMSGGKARAKTELCGPGLECTNGICTVTSDAPACLHDLRYFNENYKNKTYLIQPVCRPDGTYMPVQCEDQKRCYCVTEDGFRIFGRDLYRNKAAMNCACARKYEDLKAAGRTDITIHCLPNGNFEPLQCDLELCFCVNSTTGEPYGSVVSRHQWTGLPCYDGSYFTGKYDRQCESMNRLASDAATLMYSHGMTAYDNQNYTVRCDPDGSYYPKDCDVKLCHCRDRAGNVIGNYNVDRSHHDEVNNMDCKCARDQNDNDPATRDLNNLQCATNGNYNPEQCTAKACYCVDSWGTRVSLNVPTDIPGVGTKTRCCLPCMPPGAETCDERDQWTPHCSEEPPPPKAL